MAYCKDNKCYFAKKSKDSAMYENILLCIALLCVATMIIFVCFIAVFFGGGVSV